MPANHAKKSIAILVLICVLVTVCIAAALAVIATVMLPAWLAPFLQALILCVALGAVIAQLAMGGLMILCSRKLP